MSLPFYSRIISDPSVLPFSEVQKLKAKTYFDESFMSRSRWEIAQREAWMQSLVRGFALTPLILVNIAKCIQHCPVGSDDYDYFKNLLDQGYEYITCDGWNRNGTSGLWGDNQVSLLRGIYEVEKGYNIEVPKKGMFKEDLSEADQIQIDRIMVPVTYVEKATRSQLGEIFINVNKLVAQNAMELRQALNTDLAPLIRDLATELEPYFVIPTDGKKTTKAGIFSASNTARRFVDEFILDCVMFIHTRFAKNWTATSRDFCYSKEESGMKASYIVAERLLKSIVKRGTKKLKDTVIVDDRKMNTYSRSFAIHSPRSLFTTFVIHQLVEDAGGKITDALVFDQLVQTLHSKFWGKTPAKLQTYEGDGITPKKQLTYKSASLRNPEQVEWSVSLIMKEINVINPDLIVSTDPERLYSPSQRIDLWEKQGGIIGKCDAVCPETGKKIPFDEVFDADLWQADHIIPWSKGGKTTIENGQLICALANKIKSNSTSGYSLLNKAA
tara:strand:- start:1627 stop:3120 length:1494 start_codon:yes stop_codon:yes gene_type:complete